MVKQRALLWCAIAGAVFFIAAFVIEGATRAGYDPMRDPVSSLALTGLGWTQTANFLITGLLFALFAVGLFMSGQGRALPILVGVIALGLIGAGLFRTDPVTGYPPGASTEVTTLGTLHDLFSMGVFLGLPIACFVMAFRSGKARRWGWVAYSVATAVVFLVLFVLAGTGFTGDPMFAPIGGLMQRLCITVGWAWLAGLALDTLRGTQGNGMTAR